MIPYVARFRLEGRKGPLVSRLAQFVRPDVTLLAASIKSCYQAVAALRDGAGAVTTTWDVIESLMTYPLDGQRRRGVPGAGAALVRPASTRPALVAMIGHTLLTPEATAAEVGAS